VYYNPRHDVGRTTSASVALFGDPGRQPAGLKVLTQSAIPYQVVQEAPPVWATRTARRATAALLRSLRG
jgi:hypothetical protein